MSHITRATINLNKLSPSDKVIKTQTIKDSMQNSGNFPASTMPITYAAIQTLITNLNTAILVAASPNASSADTSHLHEQERILVSAFNFIKAHVEFIANNNADPATIITSAGLTVTLPGGANAVTELTLDALGNGKIQIRVPRLVGEKAFVIESSTDGTNWLQAGMSSLTKIQLTGLALGSTVHIRYYAISKLGKGAISQAKTLIVT